MNVGNAGGRTLGHGHSDGHLYGKRFAVWAQPRALSHQLQAARYGHGRLHASAAGPYEPIF